MFSSLIESLQNGKLPDPTELRKKFDLALVKKMGVVNLPYHFWQADPKINPPAKHLLWGAILLEDLAAVAKVVTIIQQEKEEALIASGKRGKNVGCEIDLQELVGVYREDLLALAPSSMVRDILAARCRVLDGVIVG